MDLKEAIKKKVIEPANTVNYDTLLATVTSYNSKKNRATVVFQNPRGPGEMELDNVPVQLPGNGMYSGLKYGTTVWLSFQNRNPLYPKIISVADERYEINTREELNHEKAGGLYIENKPSSLKEIIPITKAWADIGNKEESKHAYSRSVDPLEELQELIENIGYYTEDSIGITHPNSKSTIKVDDSGAIYIFTSNNNGIRVDPISQTVEIISQRVTETTGDKVQNLAGWTVNCSGNIAFNAKGNIKLNSEGKVQLYADKFEVHERGEG